MAHSHLMAKLIANCRGSVMVEVALFVPAILFLLLAGATLANIVQLSRNADRAAIVLADDFSQKAALAEGDFDIALAAMTDLIEWNGSEGTSRLNVTAIELHPDNGATFLWSRSRGEDGGNCTESNPVFTSPEGNIEGAGSLYLVQVDICATPGAGFFLASALSVMDFSVHARAIAPVRQAVLRSPD
ncbi:hypothetical protein [uncultured Sneathiella sp.]|uniref:hypothetical protein n=1 Tax=uncultured Sneathiella sp. TaxID=879315 RepID=UPI002592337E|nr:hypothetical protein [uncultured Sneathiella sp.]